MVNPDALITISSFELLILITQNIPEKKKQKGSISKSILGKLSELSIKIKLVLILSLLPNFLLNSTVSPINIIDANNKIIKPVENKNVFDIYILISEFNFIF